MNARIFRRGLMPAFALALILGLVQCGTDPVDEPQQPDIPYWPTQPDDPDEPDEPTQPDTPDEPDDDEDAHLGPEWNEYWQHHKNRGPVSTSLSGNGTQSSPYLVQSAADLRWIADMCLKGNNFSGKYFKQTAGIDINDFSIIWSGDIDPAYKGQLEQWIPIGIDNEKPFKGHYDGDDNYISGIYINRTDMNCGLFGNVSGNASIKNLRIVNSYINCPSSTNGWCYTAAVVGWFRGDKSSSVGIYNCRCTANVILKGCRVGGIAGETYQMTVKRCRFGGSVYATQRAGGITSFSNCGTNVTSLITQCINEGNITCETKVCGGISGSASYINNCVNGGKINSPEECGGIVGWFFGDRSVTTGISNNVNYGQISSKGSNIIGYVELTIPSTNSSANVTHNFGLDSQGGILTVLEGKNNKHLKQTNNRLLSEAEMKSSALIVELNKNNGEEIWDSNYDGYPTIRDLFY